MLFISIAMQHEATPFISVLGLKKNHDITRFRVYDSSRCVLVITGTGKVRSAAATASVLTRFRVSHHDLWANTGVCASACNHILPGSAAIINRITDHDTGHEIFPDMIYAHDFRECAIETFSKPVTVDNRTPDMELVDMEASAALQTARMFLPAHRTVVIKVVLDCLMPRTSTSSDISRVTGNHAASISSWLLQVSQALPEDQPCTAAIHENRRVDDMSARLRFSKAMQVEYAAVSRYALLTGNMNQVEKLALAGIGSDDRTMTRRRSRKILDLMKQKISCIPVPVHELEKLPFS